VAVWFGLLTKLAVALLFFMHGAKLSRQNLLAGLGHWRLHLVVMASTFVLFPLLGLLLTPLVPQWLSPAIYLGFLPVRPARHRAVGHRLHLHGGGNVSAAVCSASASSILGIFLSPVLVGLMINVQGEGSIPGTPFRPSWCS
jgi:sodium/bile acid cotransporter 7